MKEWQIADYIITSGNNGFTIQKDDKTQTIEVDTSDKYSLVVDLLDMISTS